MSANTFTFPSEEQIYQMVRENIVPPGLNAQLESLRSFTDTARTQLDSIVAGASGMVDNISSLSSTLTTQIQTIRGGVDSLLADVQLPVRNLQSEIQSALGTLQTAPNEFLSQIETIRSNFPSADIDSILNSIQNGTLNVVIDVPNIDALAGGLEQLRAIPSQIATEVAEAIPDLPEIPSITLPQIPDLNIQDISGLLINSNNAPQFSSELEELGHRLASLRSRIT